MATNPDQANIHDVTIEKGIVPWPREPWQNYLKKVKIEARKQSVLARSLMMKSGYTPTIDELPSHYREREGKHLGKEVIWPKADIEIYMPHDTYGTYLDGENKTDWVERSKGVECAGVNECFLLVNRGYFCAKHTMETTSLKEVFRQKASPDALKSAQAIRVWIT